MNYRKMFLVLFLTALVCPFARAGSVSVVGDLTQTATNGPGGKTEGKIIVQNTFDTAQQVRVYQTDYLFYADGRNLYGDPGSVARSNSSWITFTPRQFAVPPHATVPVYYTVQVPQDNSLKGTYWSLLMVEPLGEEPTGPLKTEAGKVTVGLRTVMRYAIQVVNTIGNAAAGDVKFSDVQLAEKDGNRILRFALENVGDRWLTPTVWAELYDAQGGAAGRFEGGRVRLYPGCSGQFAITLSQLSQLSAGKYTALVVADNGDENVFGTRYNLEIN